MKTRVTEYLDSLGINYKILMHKKEVYTCEEAASERNVPIGEMIKCILLVDKDKRYFLACTTADKKLDLNKVREVAECKRLSFASEKEIEEILGYRLGAVPPLLLKEKIPVIFDSTIKEKEKVNISSGNHLAGIELSADELIRTAKPVIEEITQNET